MIPYKLDNTILLVLTGCLVLLTVIQISASHAGAAVTPEHNLYLEFDIANHRLNATSRIELPAGGEIKLIFDGLEVESITVNGGKTEPPAAGESLAITYASRDQEIITTYSKNIPPGKNPAIDLISAEGITLASLWHPMADRGMVFKLTAVIPAEFTAISEADEIITFPMAGKKQVTFRFPHPLQLISFVAGPYTVEEETLTSGVTLASYFFTEDQELAANYRAKTKKFLERYEKLLGPYPFKRFSVVENRLPSGYAMPTFTLLGQTVVRLPFIQDTSLGHEVLHAWFGNSIHLNRAEGNWAEGLTAYLADHAFAGDEGQDTAYRKDQIIKYMSYIQPENEISLWNFANADTSQPAAKAVRAVGYGKAAMFFHMLKNRLGEPAFFEALRDFFNRMKYQEAGWSDLLVSFEKSANAELADFFDQWLTRTDIPEISVEQLKLREADGRPLLTFNLVQKTAQPYRLELPLVITTSRGQVEKTIEISELETEIKLALEDSPIAMVIDGNYDLMRRLPPEEFPPTWSRFDGAPDKTAVLAAASDPAIYTRLLQELGPDIRMITEEEITEADLQEGALIFLGTDGTISRSQFAEPAQPAGGFTVDIRNNPLNPAQVAVLVSGQSLDEVDKGAAKLTHYGKYSYLHFTGGMIKEKLITETSAGQYYSIDPPPQGIETLARRSFAEIIEKLMAQRVIHVGETHTSYEDHRLQLKIIRALHQRDPDLAIGMEMFSHAAQPALDDYLAGRLTEKEFLKKSHYFKKWSYDYRLYRDIINFAHRNRIPIIALNLEKDIVSEVFSQGGTTGLTQENKAALPMDRELDLPGYRERLASVYRHHSQQNGAGPFSGFLQAQALWDETMAETAADYLADHPEKRLVILAGQGHVAKDTAIPPRLARRLAVAQAVVVNADGRDINPDEADYQFYSPPESLPPPALLGVMLAETADESGVVITELQPLGQAKAAGIKAGDIITAIDDEPIAVIEDVKICMLFKEDSPAVKVSLRRPRLLFADRRLDIEVKLEKERKRSH